MSAGVLAAMAVLAGCATHAPALRSAGRTIGAGLRVEQLAPAVWRHISTKEPSGGPFSSNGLVVVTPRGSILVDTAFTDRQTEDLLLWIERDLGAPVRHLVVTHAHDDRLGGIAAVVRRGIPVVGHEETARRARDLGWPAAGATFPDRTQIAIGSTVVEAFFPGPGHAPDNVVVWLPEQRILFGGCLVKSAEATDLGFVGDARIEEWPASLERARARYATAVLVVPGHGRPGGIDLLDHTIDLLAASRGADQNQFRRLK